MGVTPMAFSMSGHISQRSGRKEGGKPTSEGVKTETIDFFKFQGVLIVVLDHVDEVRGREEASKGGGFTIPQRSRHNSYSFFFLVPSWLSPSLSIRSPTIMDKDIEALLHEQTGVENHQTETDRQYVIGRPHLQKLSNRTLQTVSLYSRRIHSSELLTSPSACSLSTISIGSGGERFCCGRRNDAGPTKAELGGRC